MVYNIDTMKRSIMREDETQDAYEAHKSHIPDDAPCPMCDARTERSFEHWRIIPNDFPYDRIAARHSMLVPKRHVADLGELSAEALAEYDQIEDKLEGFDAILKNLPHDQSVADHFHLHLIRYKEVEEVWSQ